MIFGNRCPPFSQTTLENLKTILSTVSWVIMVLGILFLPAFLVLASPLLISSQSISPNKTSDLSFRADTAHAPWLSTYQTSQNEKRVSPAPSSQASSPTIHHTRPDHPPAEIHLLVDTSQNQLFVKEGNRILHKAIVSTGSGNTLTDPRNPQRTWTFETPKGIFRIQSKLEKPVWIRPDWAFIEQGQPIPEKMSDRLKPGVLGPYALGFGNGFFIHGALYSNLLGRDVTHGCIQVGRKDLEYIFQRVPLGAALIIL